MNFMLVNDKECCLFVLFRVWVEINMFLILELYVLVFICRVFLIVLGILDRNFSLLRFYFCVWCVVIVFNSLVFMWSKFLFFCVILLKLLFNWMIIFWILLLCMRIFELMFKIVIGIFLGSCWSKLVKLFVFLGMNNVLVGLLIWN